MVGDLCALGLVLPVEPVGVLVAGSLPGRVRVGEVDRHLRGQGDSRVLVHLRALVPGQRATHHLGQNVEVLDHRTRRVFGVLGGQGEQAGEATHPLHQRRRAGGTVLPDDQVPFPMPGNAALGGVFAPPREGDHPDDRPAPGPARRSGPPRGPLGLQEVPAADEFAPGDRVDVLVDRLTRDGRARSVGRVAHALHGRVCSLQTQAARDLIRRPRRHQVRLHASLQHRIGGDFRTWRSALPSPPSKRWRSPTDPRTTTPPAPPEHPSCRTPADRECCYDAMTPPGSPSTF